MRLLRPYHFVQYRPAGFKPFYRRIVAAGGIVCFDFEDSIGGIAPASPATTALKQAQRHNVVQLLRHTPGLDLSRIAVRINSPHTAHYAADVAALRGLPALHAVFVPKVEHPETLLQVLDELPLPVRHLVPVLETTAAFAHLPALLAPADSRLGLVAFGHCDYNRSAGHFPFFHHDSPQYWQWLRELNQHLLATGKQLLNSPVLRLDDADHFRAVVQQLRTLASAAGQITLCLAHTQACGEAVADKLAPPAPRALADHAGPLIQHFERGRLAGHTFALDEQRRLISPHEYEAARLLFA